MWLVLEFIKRGSGVGHVLFNKTIQKLTAKLWRGHGISEKGDRQGWPEATASFAFPRIHPPLDLPSNPIFVCYKVE